MIMNDIFRDLRNLTGGTFLDTVEISDDFVNVYYFKDFESYRQKNQDTNITEEYFHNYWSTGKAVEKKIAEPVRIMKNFQQVNRIRFEFGDGAKVYVIDIEKNKFEEYTGFKISTLSNPDKWQEFIDTYIYSLKNPKRTDFFNTFTKVLDK